MLKIRPIWFALLLIGSFPIAASYAIQEQAEEPPAQAVEADPQEPVEDFSGLSEEQALARVDELTEQFESKVTEYREKIQAAAPEERAAIRREMPKPASFIGRFQKLADLFPGTKSEALALIWIFQHQRSGEAHDRALDRLVESHVDMAELKPIVLSLQYEPPSARNTDILYKLLDHTKNHEVQGVAEYVRLQLRKRAGDFKRELESDPDMEARFEQAFGKEQVEYIKALPDLSEEELLTGLEGLLANYADVVLAGDRTIGVAVEADIFEAKYLQVGKEAPDIEGEDVDGTSFKLSDYRGKVVVLDFWGDW